MTNAINPANVLNTFIAKGNAIENNNRTSGGGGGVSAGGGGGGSASWFAAMAQAWGSTMDGQASRISQMSSAIGTGNDQPSAMIALTSESFRMQYMSNNASTSLNSVAQGLEKLASKQ